MGVEEEGKEASSAAAGENPGTWFGNVVESSEQSNGDDADQLLASLGLDSSGEPAGRHLAGPRSGVSPVSAAVVGAVAMAIIIGMGAVIWFVASNRASETAAGVEGTVEAGAEAGPADLAHAIGDLQALLDVLGLDNITAELRGSDAYLTGTAQSEEEVRSALAAWERVSDGAAIDVSELIVIGAGATNAAAAAVQSAAAGSTTRDSALHMELARITASTPIIFAVGTSELSELNLRVLNNVALVMKAYPNVPVVIVGYTDSDGDPTTNEQLSRSRAGNVLAYLVSQGISQDRLRVEPRGEATSSGSDALANLERRVEFEVGAATGLQVAPNAAPLRVAVVAPSARNDLAFTQSMVDAVNVIAEERGNVEVTITDNTFIPADAAAAVRGYAEQDYDLIIAHGVEFGSTLLDIVRDHPDVTFAWGTAEETFGLPNLYAYDAAAEEGGYVMGAMSSMLTASDVVGVIGPIEVGDAKRYVDGFEAGARNQSGSNMVLVEYTGSFADIALAAEFAQAHIAAGADVLTGSAEMVVGAISVANRNGVLWFGTQANQQSLAPDVVVASQVYHWEVVLRPMFSDIDAGTHNGQAYVADLANGGVAIEYNPGFALPAPVRERAQQLTNGIINGTVKVPASG